MERQWNANGTPMERQWKAALKGPPKKTVEVDMEILYPADGSLRPSGFKVKYWIDGEAFIPPVFQNPL